MKRWQIVWLVYGAAWLAWFGVMLYWSAHRGLPHRPVDAYTNWGQGRVPDLHRHMPACPPGTTRVDVDDLFLECLRGNRNE